jgi:protein-S-isoprenylcysteine O-methyltransferase Ste14
MKSSINRGHLFIEVLSRVLWVLEGMLLFAGQYYYHEPPVLKESPYLLLSGTILLISGLSGWAHVVYSMRRAFFTKELIRKGLFRYVRHPMYVCIYLMLLGLGILFFSWVWMLILIAYIPVWYLVCRLEEKQMTEIWGQRYLDYKRDAGMFLPRVSVMGAKKWVSLKRI